jgi:hypothetical protein
MLGNREVVGTSGFFGQHAHLVDVVRDELAPPDF